MDRVARSEMELEALGLVPSEVRDLVIDRDASCCRVCGRYVEYPHLHHVLFRSQGGLDTPSNLVTIGGSFGHDCHLTIAHGRESLTWRRYLLQAIDNPGVTAVALRRQEEAVQAPPIEVTVQLFWDKVDVRGPDECWEWQASFRPHGYGQFVAKGIHPHPRGAHVYSYYFTYGRWPHPYCLHTCDNPPCVNPRHLYEGDQLQNMKDRAERKSFRGAANPAARHGDKVEEIRQRYANGESQKSIAEDLGINSGVISRIVRHINY